MKPFRYLAFGSNMNAERMKERKAFFSHRQRVWIPNYTLRFNKVFTPNPQQGVANLEKDKRVYPETEGILYELPWASIQALDYFEGFPYQYYRTCIRVKTQSGDNLSAITYLAHAYRVNDALKPSSTYLSHLLKAGDLLSPAYLEWLAETLTSD